MSEDFDRDDSKDAPAAGGSPAAGDLTDTQRGILEALCRPLREGGPHATPATNQQIAGEVFLSVDAVKGHLRALYAKLGVGDLPQNQKRARLAELALSGALASAEEREQPAGRSSVPALGLAATAPGRRLKRFLAAARARLRSRRVLAGVGLAALVLLMLTGMVWGGGDKKGSSPDANPLTVEPPGPETGGGGNTAGKGRVARRAANRSGGPKVLVDGGFGPESTTEAGEPAPEVSSAEPEVSSAEPGVPGSNPAGSNRKHCTDHRHVRNHPHVSKHPHVRLHPHVRWHKHVRRHRHVHVHRKGRRHRHRWHDRHVRQHKHERNHRHERTHRHITNHEHVKIHRHCS